MKYKFMLFSPWLLKSPVVAEWIPTIELNVHTFLGLINSATKRTRVTTRVTIRATKRLIERLKNGLEPKGRRLP